MRSLDQFAQAKLARLEAGSLRRQLVETTRGEGAWVERNGQRLLSFSCNDYLNLSRHPAVIAAALEATRRHGVGAGASRLITGNHPLLAELEARLARLKGSAACCLFGSGYLANAGLIPALMGEGDLILLDELAHSCLWAGARLSGARVEVFRHNDVAQAASLLAARRPPRGRAMIATDGVFSMDGDLAPLDALADVAEAHEAWLLSDDAHGIGVLNDGHGTAHPRVPLQMGTLSKAVGGYGGYVCASAPVVELLRNRARSFVYSTGLPPGVAAAAIAALDVIERDPAYAALPLAKARAFTVAAGLPLAQSPIVPLVLGEAAAALAASRALEAEGFLVTAIRPPTVPPGTARLRFAFSALQPDEEIARLAALVRRLPAQP
ncbi:aminotransferase class I/II-fold pyridoxal phosphate-dependent enzyme [Acidocella sp.]|uniref:aminotransferase class I/II-fold pyridoxal phosphate-dependent enzyme n=1 Tax=Acidocella sp. TaxID=50710 RepID=UPI00262882A4|nr:aminotransferase class I/II-fold pyridoxal phosphate-dependent enzyme [Acidocella sp.]